jgi:hypothetical protein
MGMTTCGFVNVCACVLKITNMTTAKSIIIYRLYKKRGEI